MFEEYDCDLTQGEKLHTIPFRGPTRDLSVTHTSQPNLVPARGCSLTSHAYLVFEDPPLHIQTLCYSHTCLFGSYLYTIVECQNEPFHRNIS